MAAEKTDLLTSGAIAKELKLSPAAVAKAIQALKLKPEIKKGVCSYYSKESVNKIKTSLKK